MTTESAYAPQWTKLIARAWVDPKFRADFEADPSQVMSSYGIEKVGGKDVNSLAGKISVVEAPSGSTEKPHMDGDRMVLPFPAPPKSYDTVVDPASVAVAGAGSPGNPHTNWATIHGGTATVWTSGTPGVQGVETGQGPNDSKTPGGQPKSQSNQNNPSIPSLPDMDDDDDDDDADGADAGADAGGDAAEAGADVAVEAGSDAAADAAAAAAALCA